MKKLLFSTILASIIFFSLFSHGLASEFSQDADAIEKATASVVKLYILNEKGEEIATGSGFVAIDNQTLITNYHVIEDGKKIIAVSDAGEEYEIGLLYCADKDYDVAILGFNSPTNMIPLPLNNRSEIKRGEKVVAIGSPIGIRNTVSIGNVSAVYEDNGIPWIQFTAPISKGSSGGPLLNDSGTVIGITSAFFVDGQNMNIAIDISIPIAMYNGWNGKPHNVGDDVSKAIFDFSNQDKVLENENEFSDWTLLQIEDMSFSVPEHFTAYTIQDLKKDYSVLKKYKSESEWAAYFEGKPNNGIYLVNQQADGYDIEIYVKENKGRNYHIFNTDEMKRIIEYIMFENENILKYGVFDHSQTVFASIETLIDDTRYQWNIWTEENGVLYDMYCISCTDFDKEQESEIEHIIKSIFIKNAYVQKKKNYINRIDGDINNIPSTEYKLEKVHWKIVIPNYFGVFYTGLDSNYFQYRYYQNKAIVKSLSDETYFLIAVKRKYEVIFGSVERKNDIIFGEKIKIPSNDFSSLSYSELLSKADYYFPPKSFLGIPSRQYLGRVRIIDNLQSPFIRAVYKEDGQYNVVYYTVYNNNEYCLQYTNANEDYIIDEKTLRMLDDIVLSIQFI